MKHTHFRPGFTLVELLVVIGIISVLISILLPTLGKAREAANRTACLSNMHQVHVAMVMYGQENKDFVPLGAYYWCDRANFVLWWWDSYYSVAMLYPKYLRSPQVFYCPSEIRPWFQYNGSQNLFKVGNPSAAANNPGPQPYSNGGQVLMSYGTRVTGPVNAAAHGNAFPQGREMYWYPIYGASATPVVEIRDFYTWLNDAKWSPKLSKFKSMAIMSDLFSNPSFVDSVHKTGINVLYANGSAKWVNRSAFNANLRNLPPDIWNFSYNVLYFTPIWLQLDNQ